MAIREVVIFAFVAIFNAVFFAARAQPKGSYDYPLAPTYLPPATDDTQLTYSAATYLPPPIDLPPVTGFPPVTSAEIYLPPSAELPTATYIPPATDLPSRNDLPPATNYPPVISTAIYPVPPAELPPAPLQPPGTDLPPATNYPPVTSTATDLPEPLELDPGSQIAISYLEYTFVAFPTNLEITKTPYCYRFGYEIQDSAKGTFERHYETRLGDVSVGNYTKIEADGHRLHIDYTAETLNGLKPIIRVDNLQHNAMSLGYASYAAPQAFASHHTPEEYTFKTNTPDDEDTPLCKSSSLIKTAYKIHNIFLDHTSTEGPLKYSFGTEICDKEAGSTRSHYEIRDGECGEGNYVVVGVDGGRSSVDYIVNNKGFALRTPVS